MSVHSPTHPALRPGVLQNLTLPNRYVVAPMSRASATDNGVPTEAMAHYYARFATGGFGLIIAEGPIPTLAMRRPTATSLASVQTRNKPAGKWSPKPYIALGVGLYSS